MLKKMILFAFALLLFTGLVVAQNDADAKSDAPVVTAEANKTSSRFTPTKAQIQAGQEFLKAKKLYSGETAGKYNEETRSAIRVFQKDNGMTVTGNFNQATLEKMNIPLTDKQKGISVAPAAATSDKNTLTAKTAPATSSKTSASAPKVALSSDSTTDAETATVSNPKRTAPFQATKEQIAALQNVLIKGKMFTGEANGERSEALKEAVKKYQEANGLKATGGINAVTLEKAGIALTDKQKGQAAAAPTADAAKSSK